MIKITIKDMTIEIPEGHSIVEALLGGITKAPQAVVEKSVELLGQDEETVDYTMTADTSEDEAVANVRAADELAARKRSEASKKAAETKAANKAKAEAEALAEVPAEKIETTSIVETTPAPEAEEVFTLAGIREYLGELQSKGFVVNPLIKEVGAVNLTSMKPEMYPKLMTLAKALEAKGVK